MTDSPNTAPSPDGTEAAPPPPYQAPAEGTLPPPYQAPAEGTLPPPYQPPVNSPFTPAEAPKSSGGLFGRPIVRTILGLAVASAVGLGVQWYSHRSDPENAAVGDCIQRVGDSDAKKVDCASPDAQFKVLAKVLNVKRSATTEELCASQPTTTHSLWQGKSDKDDAIGFALCLEEIVK